MPQAQYRLRLTEGTLLVVDHDALTTWLTDDKALVQPMGSHRWRLLRQFLADERSGIGSNYWEAPPAADDGRARTQRPRVSMASAPPVARILSAPVRPSPSDYDSNGIFGPDLSEGDAIPWDWAVDQSDLLPRPEPDAGDFEFPNDEQLTLDDLLAPSDSDRAPVLSPEAAALRAATSDPLSEVLDEAPGERLAPTTTTDADSLLAGLLESPAITRPRVQVLADELTPAPAATRDELKPLSLKALDTEPSVPAPTPGPEDAPLEFHESEPGLIGRFADWSGTISDWLDKGQEVAAHRREYEASVTDTLRQVGPRLQARLREAPDESRAMLLAWRELVSGWIADLRVWWSARRDHSRPR
jgi:hypothetical protein